MHITLNSKIKGHLDSNVYLSSEEYLISGWSVNPKKKADHFYIKEKGKRKKLLSSHVIERPDVREVYEDAKYANSGFEFIFKPETRSKFIEVYISYSDKSSDLVFSLNTLDKLIPISKSLSKVTYNSPDLVVIDNFYDNPDEIRKIAMDQTFKSSGLHKGKRTESRLILDGTKEALENILNRRITDWNQLFNGVFQYCTAQDSLVYHADAQTYAAVVFLTPDAPPETGTSFWRSKTNGVWRSPTEEDLKNQNKGFDEVWHDMFGNPPNFYDRSKWEQVDYIGNRYNRLAIWNSKLIHSANQYFGDSLDNSRLFHMFFFDCE